MSVSPCVRVEMAYLLVLVAQVLKKPNVKGVSQEDIPRDKM